MRDLILLLVEEKIDYFIHGKVIYINLGNMYAGVTHLNKTYYISVVKEKDVKRYKEKDVKKIIDIITDEFEGCDDNNGVI